MASRTKINGRLLAVTSTGPIYRGEGEVAIVPISVGLALLQELALRSLRPDAHVASSLASRVSGEEAEQAWNHVCGCAVGSLVSASPRARLTFLDNVLVYVRSQGNVNGIEPVLASAINAAWPFMTYAALTRVMAYATELFRQSMFAQAFEVPVFDPNIRTLTFLKPGELGKLDPKDWLDWKLMRPRGYDNNTDIPSGLDPRGLPGGMRGPDLSPFGGPDLSGSSDPGMGGLESFFDTPGAMGGLDLSSVGGPNLSGSGDTGSGLIGDLLGLRPGRKPDFRGEGPDAGGIGDPSLGLAGFGVPGAGLDLSNLGRSGGPLGFGSAKGSDGVFTERDLEKNRATNQKQDGRNEMLTGNMIMLAGIVLVTGSGGNRALIIGALVMVAAGSAFVIHGAINKNEGEKKEDAIELARPGPAPAQPAAAREPAPAPSPAPAPAPAPTSAPTPPPKEPRKGDLYPDPHGTGGGNPKQLPDHDGHGGGNPATLWDEDGGGGNPETIWDENGGGGTPTTIWDGDDDGGTPTTVATIGTVQMLSGRGILASVSLIGPKTYKL